MPESRRIVWMRGWMPSLMQGITRSPGSCSLASPQAGSCTHWLVKFAILSPARPFGTPSTVEMTPRAAVPDVASSAHDVAQIAAGGTGCPLSSEVDAPAAVVCTPEPVQAQPPQAHPKVSKRSRSTLSARSTSSAQSAWRAAGRSDCDGEPLLDDSQDWPSSRMRQPSTWYSSDVYVSLPEDEDE